MQIVELKLTENEKGQGISAISLVRYPAIEQRWIAFSEGQMEFAMPKNLKFKTVDEEQRILVGPAMIPDKLIYRIDDEGAESFVFFKEGTIRELSERFLIQGKQSFLTLEHEATLNDLSVVESWIVEDSKKDKSAIYGFNLPVGTWFVKVKVLSDEIWNLVKSGDVQGFSVEGVFAREIIKQSKQMSEKTKLDTYLEKIRGMFNVEEKEEQEEQEKFGTVEVQGQDATVTITFPGDTLEVGDLITHEVDGTDVPVPTGEYLLPDSRVLVVIEEGVAGEIREAESEMEEEPDEMEKEDGLKAEQIDKLIDGIAEIISTFQTEVRKEFKTEVEKSAAKLREEFNKPADDHHEEAPDDTSRRKIVKGLNAFVKEQKGKK